MSDILIRGMEMPKSCNYCPMHFYEGQGICSCRVLGAIEDDEILKPWKKRRKDCPLVPVPPHGRLIDADKLADSFEPSDFWNPDAEDNCFAAVRIVHSAPTVIPAEEVYGQYTDTAGNFHWTGTHSGEHKIKIEGGE